MKDGYIQIPIEEYNRLITEYNRLCELAFVDQLTGAYNRNFLQEFYKDKEETFSRPKEFKDNQFEIFYMILVLLFGDYGTSPRYGWLEMENKGKIIKFIDEITVTERECERR